MINLIMVVLLMVQSMLVAVMLYGMIFERDAA